MEEIPVYKQAILNTLKWLTALLIILFLSLRFTTLASYNSGFFVDESSIGLNADLILKTGQDQHGEVYPLFFKAFGEYKNPLYIYSVVPVIATLGTSIFSVRLTSFIWSVASIGVLIILLKKARIGIYQGTLVVLFTVSSPWYFSLSGTAFEVAALPFFILTACLSLFVLSEKITNDVVNTKWAVVAGLSLGLFFYSYTAARLLTPLLVVSAAVLVWKNHSLKYAVVLLSSAAICAVPLLFSESVMSGALFARYSTVGLSHYVNGPYQLVTTALQQYGAHFLPEYLLFGGDHNLRHVPDPYGIVLISAVPFLIAGIVSLYKKNDLFSRWCLFGLLISPIPSALTIQSPHVLRATTFSVFLIIVYWYGVCWWFDAGHIRRNTFALVLSILLILDSTRFMSFASNVFPQYAAAWYEADTVAMAQVAAKESGPYFVSQQLYPGTEATLFFFIRASFPEQKDMAYIDYVPGFINYTLLPGTYVLDTVSCYKVDSDVTNEKRFLFMNKAGCVIQLL